MKPNIPKKLTEQRKKKLIAVYRYIVRYKQLHDGLSPSLRDIAKETSFSKTCVYLYLIELDKKGVIKMEYFRKAILIPGALWTPPTEAINL